MSATSSRPDSGSHVYDRRLCAEKQPAISKSEPQNDGCAEADSGGAFWSRQVAPKMRRIRRRHQRAASGSPTGPSIFPPAHNLRNVWVIPTRRLQLKAPFRDIPSAMVEPCIKAGTSEKGVCGECGAPWVRMVDCRDSTTMLV